jgi:hypothetical protein
MSAKSSSAITVAVVLFAGILSAPSAGGQDASVSSLADQLKTQYKLTKTGSDSSGLAIVEPGTVLVIRKGGILGVPPASLTIAPATYKDGDLHSPNAAAGNDTRLLSVGEKVYITKIDVNLKNDKVAVTIIECDSCNGAQKPSFYKSMVVFQFPKDYLTAAEVGQIEDVISQVLTIDNGTSEAQQQASGGQSSPGVLTNEEIIKLVQAKLPDSVVLAKIKSSSCDFDTSTDALIKLKRAGVSDPVLQAIVDARPQSNSSKMVENSAPADPGKQPVTAPECGNYDSCIKIATALLGSSRWDRALARFQEASQLDASRGDAWAGIGYADLQMGQYDDAVAMWDKALQLGSSLSLSVCHAKFACGDTGIFSLNLKEVSFVNKKGEKELAAAPSAVTSEGAVLFSSTLAAYYLQVRFAGKNYRFYYLPNKDIGCRDGFICPEPGVTQQKIFGDYVHGTLVRMAAGDFGSQPNKP